MQVNAEMCNQGGKNLDFVVDVNPRLGFAVVAPTKPIANYIAPAGNLKITVTEALLNKTSSNGVLWNTADQLIRFAQKQKEEARVSDPAIIVEDDETRMQSFLDPNFDFLMGLGNCWDLLTLIAKSSPQLPAPIKVALELKLGSTACSEVQDLCLKRDGKGNMARAWCAATCNCSWFHPNTTLEFGGCPSQCSLNSYYVLNRVNEVTKASQDAIEALNFSVPH